ncbi:hypothetical protein AAF712_004304 [Marasmius tenuissimus]|uniref:Protein kinase domain-containing protein n=1 Tax=Marasmius tenuissimus TaxID=585030 RepID=A0ABR3A6G8_9AGAR|nr:hypothetical protein PM082_003331 [Marasmius tenuissimus]
MPAPAQLELIYSPGNNYNLRSLDSKEPPQHARVIRKLSGKVYQARIGLKGQETNRTVALKIARGQDQVRMLYHEAQVYQGELKPLQGTVVPKYHGSFMTRIDGTEVAVMVLEYCGNTPQQMAMKQIPTVEYTRKLMIAICKLHQAGVVHGSIRLDQQHHILEVGHELRIVDFTNAGRFHTCVGGTPVLVRGGRHDQGCAELVMMEEEFGASENEDAVAVVDQSRQTWRRAFANRLPW